MSRMIHSIALGALSLLAALAAAEEPAKPP